MDTSSLWQGTAVRTACLPTLQTDIVVDVAIVGAGITGLTTAMRLVEAGRRVAVLEADRVGGGSSGHSTGNLYAPVDMGLATLERERDADTVRQVVAGRAAAVDLIEATVARLGLDCGFRRVPWHSIAADAAHVRAIEIEHAAAVRAGLPARLVDGAAVGLHPAVALERALRIDGQAQFQPLDYLRQLLLRIAGENCLVFENTRVLAVDDAAGAVRTEHGSVTAGAIVLATHTPAGIHLVQSQLETVREYAIAAPLHDAQPAPGIYWSLGTDNHSLRSHTAFGRPYLVVVGSAHPAGAAVGDERYRRLDAFARDRFPIGPVEYRWSAQRYRAQDKLPFIGRNVDAVRTWIATGFSADGLVYGTLAGMLLADGILGRAHPWHGLYDPARLLSGGRPDGFKRESTGPAAPDHPPELDAVTQARLADLPPCRSRKIALGGQPVGVYRRADGALLAVAGKCSHMGCELTWNAAETSWDCHCHGSRFGPDGRVLEGPALAPLGAAALAPGRDAPA
jgi:glycine/D-amino acid oxidase-like deaminating enzyme/nitrite reductase/ring-hydroxylating ferredoxin subunit